MELFLNDSLYGIQPYRGKMAGRRHVEKDQGFLLADMIGDADLNIERGAELHSLA